MAASDIVSLHLPLTEATAGLLDSKALASMKPGAVVVNTARGPIIDEPALVEALRTGRLAAAGLDVFAEEPVPPGNPCWSCPMWCSPRTSPGTPSTPCAAT